MAGVATAALESGIYYTIPGTTVEEIGDLVPGERRIVPMSAILTFDLGATPPSLTAVIPNAVLELRRPFALTVRSAGRRLADGSYRFEGDYVNAGYGFIWTFSTASDGSVRWNGAMTWWGGRFWYVTISNLEIKPPPRVEITRIENMLDMLEISWRAEENCAYALEETDSLAVPAGSTAWSPAAGEPRIENGRRVMIVPQTPGNKFYRLRGVL